MRKASTTDPVARLRGLLRRSTQAPWVVEAVELDGEGKILQDHPSWADNPWHTTVGWSDADRELIQLVVRELPALLDAAETLAKARAAAAEPDAEVFQLREVLGVRSRLELVPSTRPA